MKLIISFITTLLILILSDIAIFTEDVIVKDIKGKEVNLQNIKITKDTVMIFVWCKTCGSCIKCLDYYKARKRYQNYQILAIAITKGDSIETEKTIINKHHWTFQMYFDNKQKLAKYMSKKGYFKFKPRKKTEEIGYYGFPQRYMFVKNKFLCNGCDKYANPYSLK
ncbi:MAG: hypothetical protein COX07_04905 [Bacteroidetes bacterium CG23_combo_of_CG06-09_8_20_14_all_32_9]|nr:MAG: hypothetical protein COX07_04905 [Bacteroidetes bacterium CG23_combo_of_CG06-09_8_20_14_all_32_9]